jgi:hypothetical protein
MTVPPEDFELVPPPARQKAIPLPKTAGEINLTRWQKKQRSKAAAMRRAVRSGHPALPLGE